MDGWKWLGDSGGGGHDDEDNVDDINIIVKIEIVMRMAMKRNDYHLM